MNRIIFATSNTGKMKEIREILKDLDVEILSMKEAELMQILWRTGKPLKRMR